MKLRLYTSLKRKFKRNVTQIATQILELDEQKKLKNIEFELQRLALSSTAEYVEKTMSQVSSVSDSLDLLKKSIEDWVINKDGLFCEFGVFSGKTINYVANLINSVSIYGFDSFEGLPENWRDGFQKGCFAVSSLPEVENNVVLVKGWFNETIPGFLQKHPEKISFLHIDCDLYSSTKTVFDYLKDRIQSGTVIVFDEYFNYSGWQQGEYKAFQEFIANTQNKYEYLGYNRMHEQVAVRIL
jgi:hypothetical protein